MFVGNLIDLSSLNCNGWNKSSVYSIFSQPNMNMVDCFFTRFALYVNNENFLEFVSISMSTFETSYGTSSVSIENGVQNIKNTNSSVNMGEGISSFNIIGQNTLFFLNTISNNRPYGPTGGCLWPKDISISLLNIVNNTSPGMNGIITSYSHEVKIDSCVFHSNMNTLFCSSSTKYIISNCHIAHSGQLKTGVGTFSTSNNNSFTYSNSFLINHFQTFMCLADAPPQSPSFLKSPHTYLSWNHNLIFIFLTIQ